MSSVKKVNAAKLIHLGKSSSKLPKKRVISILDTVKKNTADEVI